MRLFVLDIEEQTEVIQFTKDAIHEISQRNPSLDLKFTSHQLKSLQLESCYDFSSIKLSSAIDCALMHTKVFKLEEGQFRDADWWLNFIHNLFRNQPVRLVLYSGDIHEFKSWSEMNAIATKLKSGELNYVDVFDLIYPPNHDSYAQWLESWLTTSN